MNINQAIVQALAETRHADPLPAIKRIRELTGCGLGEAKLVYELANKRRVVDGQSTSAERVLSAVMTCMQEQALTQVKDNGVDSELRTIEQIMLLLKDRPSVSVKRILTYLSSRCAD